MFRTWEVSLYDKDTQLLKKRDITILYQCRWKHDVAYGILNTLMYVLPTHWVTVSRLSTVRNT